MKGKIYACEAYYGGSHKTWLNQLRKCSSFHISIFTHPARFWKWRMHGSAITLVDQLPGESPDMFLITDMMDGALFSSLIHKEHPSVPIILYFHENQFGYPWSDDDKEKKAGREYHYQFINISSALAADYLVFNSSYHKQMFLDHVDKFFKQMPDYTPDVCFKLGNKSTVLYPGIQIAGETFQKREINEKVVFLWNHRREHDKNPEDFEKFIQICSFRNIDFELILLGASKSHTAPVFERIAEKFSSSIIFNGFAESPEHYISLLSRADFAPIFSNQDYFGISIMECCSLGVLPLLPNRLSYPELYSELTELFHSGPESAVELMQGLDTSRMQELRKTCGHIASHYSWDKLIASYDSFFTSIINSKTKN